MEQYQHRISLLHGRPRTEQRLLSMGIRRWGALSRIYCHRADNTRREQKQAIRFSVEKSLGLPV
jgi:hypothetical protein